MKVVLIGSGNVATHLATAFQANGHVILQVWSATLKRAVDLAEKVSSEPIQHLSQIYTEAELIVISVKDDAISEVVSQLEHVKAIVVHTSGATNISVIDGMSEYGVLYPLQTFSKDKPLDFKQVPLCVEGNSAACTAKLVAVAKSLSNTVYEVDSVKRRILHVAAAFACNFVNQLYVLSNELLEAQGLDFNLLRPLIKETADKVQHLQPLNVQTGPAVRHDEQTLKNHLELLQGQPELQHIYQSLSDSIKKSHQ
jgi:predicted short-subunit dehydrogenase-like oxidoreductase (DUF2520 family)